MIFAKCFLFLFLIFPFSSSLEFFFDCSSASPTPNGSKGSPFSSLSQAKATIGSLGSIDSLKLNLMGSLCVYSLDFILQANTGLLEISGQNNNLKFLAPVIVDSETRPNVSFKLYGVSFEFGQEKPQENGSIFQFVESTQEQEPFSFAVVIQNSAFQLSKDASFEVASLFGTNSKKDPSFLDCSFELTNFTLNGSVPMLFSQNCTGSLALDGLSVENVDYSYDKGPFHSFFEGTVKKINSKETSFTNFVWDVQNSFIDVECFSDSDNGVSFSEMTFTNSVLTRFFTFTSCDLTFSQISFSNSSLEGVFQSLDGTGFLIDGFSIGNGSVVQGNMTRVYSASQVTIKDFSMRDSTVKWSTPHSIFIFERSNVSIINTTISHCRFDSESVPESFSLTASIFYSEFKYKSSDGSSFLLENAFFEDILSIGRICHPNLLHLNFIQDTVLKNLQIRRVGQLSNRNQLPSIKSIKRNATSIGILFFPKNLRIESLFVSRSTFCHHGIYVFHNEADLHGWSTDLRANDVTFSDSFLVPLGPFQSLGLFMAKGSVSAEIFGFKCRNNTLFLPSSVNGLLQKKESLCLFVETPKCNLTIHGSLFTKNNVHMFSTNNEGQFLLADGIGDPQINTYINAFSISVTDSEFSFSNVGVFSGIGSALALQYGSRIFLQRLKMKDNWGEACPSIFVNGKSSGSVVVDDCLFLDNQASSLLSGDAFCFFGVGKADIQIKNSQFGLRKGQQRKLYEIVQKPRLIQDYIYLNPIVESLSIVLMNNSFDTSWHNIFSMALPYYDWNVTFKSNSFSSSTYRHSSALQSKPSIKQNELNLIKISIVGSKPANINFLLRVINHKLNEVFGGFYFFGNHFHRIKCKGLINTETFNAFFEDNHFSDINCETLISGQMERLSLINNEFRNLDLTYFYSKSSLYFMEVFGIPPSRKKLNVKMAEIKMENVSLETMLSTNATVNLKINDFSLSNYRVSGFGLFDVTAKNSTVDIQEAYFSAGNSWIGGLGFFSDREAIFKNVILEKSYTVFGCLVSNKDLSKSGMTSGCQSVITGVSPWIYYSDTYLSLQIIELSIVDAIPSENPLDSNYFDDCDIKTDKLRSDSTIDPVSMSKYVIWNCNIGSFRVQNAGNQRKPLEFYPGVGFKVNMAVALLDQNDQLVPFLIKKPKRTINVTTYTEDRVAMVRSFELERFQLYFNLSLTTETIMETAKKFFNNSFERMPVSIEIPSINLSIDILVINSSCPSGYSLNFSDGECSKCPFNYFSMPGEVCRQCQNGCYCLEGVIYPKTGYWRYISNSSIVILCLEPKSCLGETSEMDQTTRNNSLFSNFSCDTGYMSPLCKLFVFSNYWREKYEEQAWDAIT